MRCKRNLYNHSNGTNKICNPSSMYFFPNYINFSHNVCSNLDPLDKKPPKQNGNTYEESDPGQEIYPGPSIGSFIGGAIGPNYPNSSPNSPKNNNDIYFWLLCSLISLISLLIYDKKDKKEKKNEKKEKNNTPREYIQL